MCLFEFKALCCDDLPHEVFINHSVPPASRRKYSQTFLLCLFDIPTFLLCIAQAELAVFGFGDAPHTEESQERWHCPGHGGARLPALPSRHAPSGLRWF